MREGFRDFTLTKYSCGQLKRKEMGGACGTYGEEKFM